VLREDPKLSDQNWVFEVPKDRLPVSNGLETLEREVKKPREVIVLAPGRGGSDNLVEIKVLKALRLCPRFVVLGRHDVEEDAVGLQS
jgi:hypothetical protein